MSTAVSANDRLRHLAHRPGPYVSVYLDCSRGTPDPVERFDAQRGQLAAAGASDAALDAVAARLALPAPDDTAGRAVIAADDGTTTADASPEALVRDLFLTETLPYAAPLVEWEQWRLPHLVVTVTDEQFEIVGFVPGAEPFIRPVGPDVAEAATLCARTARADQIPLIVIAGKAETAEMLRSALLGVVPVRTQVVVLLDDEFVDLDAFASAVVKEVADHVARTTVGALQEFRFLRSHDAAVEGAEATIDWLNHNRGDLLLIHDDPDDDRRAWFGPTHRPLSLVTSPDHPHEGRLVDVAIQTAIGQRVDVRVIPSTGTAGPDGDIALIARDAVAGPASPRTAVG